MGTSGIYGIRKDRIDKCALKTWDAGPEELGYAMLNFCKKHTLDEIRELFDRIEFVNPKKKPDLKDREFCKKNGWYNPQLYSHSDTDWMTLLANTEGNLESLIQREKAYMINGMRWIEECDFAYIINLDINILEFRVGYQNEPFLGNRYGAEKYGKYYPCKIKKAYTLPLTKSVEWYIEDMKKALY